MNVGRMGWVVRVWWVFGMVSWAGAASLWAQQAPNRIEVEYHKSVLKRTDRPVTRVSIADPRVADVQLVTPTQILVVSKEQPGGTTLMLWYGEKEVDVYDVVVYIPEQLVERIQAGLRQMVPGAQLRFLRTEKSLVVDGTVASQEDLDKVSGFVQGFAPGFTNLVSIGGCQQVQLDVKVVEISVSGLKRMGFGLLTQRGEWAIGLMSNGTAGGLMTAGAARTSGVGSNYRTMDSVAEFFGGANSYQIIAHEISDNFLGILSMLKAEGMARVLANPTLVAMSGQEASFLVGGEFPIPVQGYEQTVTIEFKAYGIQLRFMPTVVGKETITLEVAPEVSVPDYSLAVTSGGVAVPGLKTRRADATLQLKDGQGFVMAGLLSEDSSALADKLPFAGDIPVLGSLFTSKEFKKNETELVVVVQAHLVRPLNRGEVGPLPGDDTNDNVNDWEFFLFNKLRTGDKRRGKETTSHFVGPVGFSR